MHANGANEARTAWALRVSEEGLESVRRGACLLMFAAFLKDVRTDVYYIVSEYGSNGISIASSNGQALKLLQASVQ
ncbi:hypothetical protein GBA52_017556 [Prunus armeniaca]|nr:hypothetical protein GBA52_017556 [Prunus armeniaca]